MEKPTASTTPTGAGTGHEAGLPGMAAFADSLEMIKRMWGLPAGPAPAGSAMPGSTLMPGLGGTIPSMFLPTVDVAELDKRIADLRSVEQWLNLNASMLRTTIQSLEVQRNTLAALRAFGGTMLGSMAAAAPAASASTARPQADADEAGKPRKGRAPRKTEAPPPLPFNAAQWWATLQDQFMRVAASALQDPAAGTASPGETPAGAPAGPPPASTDPARR
ncbi:MAG TPA: PhaM family polyhydroxyalkanoate granule multifunctional regulatory protein [Burkholderiaceae bacterium]|nr:PhaM family polyhydroxyalkanoate granule multifunctional regulatory protein [Burkholderiaceae bacterium]